MSNEKKYYWLKLYDDFFTSLRIKKLRRLAGGDTFVIIYLKMQLLAMKNDGIIKWKGLDDSFADELALDLDEDPDNVKVTLAYLISCGLAETSDNISYFFPFSVANTGSETSAAERMRKMRERNNVTPALRDCYTEIDKEKEKDTESDKKPPTAREMAKEALKDRSEALREAVDNWLLYKQEKRQPYRATGLKALLTEIGNKAAAQGEAAVVAAIQYSMSRNYQGIIFDSGTKSDGKTGYGKRIRYTPQDYSPESGACAKPEDYDFGNVKL